MAIFEDENHDSRSWVRELYVPDGVWTELSQLPNFMDTPVAAIAGGRPVVVNSIVVNDYPAEVRQTKDIYYICQINLTKNVFFD